MSMRILRPSQRIHRIPGIGIRDSRRAVADSLPWYYGGGTITDASIREWVENPMFGQLYTGGDITSGQPWSIACSGISYDMNDGYGAGRYLMDSQSGRLILGYSSPGEYGFYANGWNNRNMFYDTDFHVWFLVSDGSNIQAYMDNAAIGVPKVSGISIGGTTRWKSRYSAWYIGTWDNAINGAVYNIALDATQRTALYDSMLA